MHHIPYLEKGDTILIISPAKSIDQLYINKAVDLFQSWGLMVEIGNHALGQHHYFSGTDLERTKDLQWALDHPSAKAIICARGGYGTIRIINNINFNKFKIAPKWVIGFSDITILHSLLHSQLKHPSIHGAVPLQFDQLAPNGETLSTLRKTLFGEKFEIEFPASPTNKSGEVTAPLIGGNLAIIESLIGTNMDIDTRGKILFFEEVSEYAYKLDRMMWSLFNSGKLSNLAGLIIGGLTNIKECEKTFGYKPEELVASFTTEHSYPVAFNFPAGHQLDNQAMVFGNTYHLNVQKNKCVLKMT